MFRLALVVAVTTLAMTGCRSGGDSSSRSTSTLTSNGSLPGAEIKEYVSAETWRQIGGREIERYVAFSAQIRDDGTVMIGEARVAWPDHAWDAIARRFGQDAVINASANSGSKLMPRGEIFVIFFKQFSNERPVLIYGYEVGKEPPIGSGTTYRNQHLGTDKQPEWVRRPQYFRLTVY